jgi:hypothetical protein
MSPLALGPGAAAAFFASGLAAGRQGSASSSLSDAPIGIPEVLLGAMDGITADAAAPVTAPHAQQQQQQQQPAVDSQRR